MSTLNKYLGIALKGSNLSYCLIIDEAIKKAGTISLKCATNEHPVRINNILTLLKKDVHKTTISSTEETQEDAWGIGLESNEYIPRSVSDAKRELYACRILSIVEANSNIIFKTKPYLFTTRCLIQTISKLANAHDANATTLEQVAKSKMNILASSVDDMQFTAIGYAWATAVCLKVFLWSHFKFF
ncbi:hypothetical protein BdWA1_001844 [Babesia duncani]|uniref:Uncharacterized protein n=1 Tax=Babesia duncani TaxID=323732 RepID=A0AAD9PL74_9APIC|nr:hypothetical protein BdWA1_001844 [Babesia duncani]